MRVRSGLRAGLQAGLWANPWGVGALLGLGIGLFVGIGCSNETRVNELEPANGTYVGGEEIQIKGNGFNAGHGGGVAVKFGKRDATNIVVESDHTIKVTSPPGDKNAKADITVVFDDGRAYLLKNGFTYLDATDQSKVMKNFFDKKK